MANPDVVFPSSGQRPCAVGCINAEDILLPQTCSTLTEKETSFVFLSSCQFSFHLSHKVTAFHPACRPWRKCNSAPIGDSNNQISDSFCLCFSLASTKLQHFLLSQEKSMSLAHLHSQEWQAPRSLQCKQSWSILETRTKDWGQKEVQSGDVRKVVSIAFTNDQSLNKHTSLLLFWVFLC